MKDNMKDGMPWTATTPTTRLAKLEPKDGLPEAPPPPTIPKPNGDTPAAGSGQVHPRVHLDALKQILGDKLPKDAEKAIIAAADMEETDVKLTHGMLNKVTTAQKNMQKAKEEVRELDVNWKEFQTLITNRYNAQKDAYIAKRKEAVEVYANKKEKWQTLQAAMLKMAQQASLKQEEDVKLEQPPPEMELFAQMEVEQISDDEEGLKDIPVNFNAMQASPKREGEHQSSGPPTKYRKDNGTKEREA